MDLNETLKESYQSEEIRRKALAAAKREEQIALLKRKLHNAECTPEEYLAEVENHMRLLQNENRQLAPMRARIDELLDIKEKNEAEIAALKYDNKNLQERLEAERIRHALELENLRLKYETEIRELKEKYEAEICELKENYETKLRELEEKYETEIRELKESYEKEICELKETYEKEIRELKEKYEAELCKLKENHEAEICELKEGHETEISELKAKHETEILECERQWKERLAFAEDGARLKEEQFDEKLKEVKNLLSESEAKCGELDEKCEALLEKNRFCEARLKGRQWQSGEPFAEEAFTEKEDFDELEKELEAFMNFYDDRWDKVKKKIRKRLLNYQSLKGRTGKN